MNSALRFWSIFLSVYKSLILLVSKMLARDQFQSQFTPRMGLRPDREDEQKTGSAAQQPLKDSLKADDAPTSHVLDVASPNTSVTTPLAFREDKLRKKPNICLIGTSNGVFEDGYVRVFRSSKDVGTFSKNCLGFSSSALFSVMSRRIDFTAFDICVLDFAVNDGAQNKGGTASASVIKSTVSDAVRSILQAGCLPALLILPVRSLMQDNNNEIRNIYLDIAEEYALPVFDGYRYLENRRLQHVNVPGLFKDDMHLSRDVAAHLVGLFLEGLLIAHRLRRTGKELTGSGFTYNYIGIGETDVGTIPITHRGTSLFMADIAHVAGVPGFSVDGLPEATEIAALAIDFANSSGTLTVSSGDLDKNASDMVVTNPYAGDDPKRFILGLYPLKPPISIVDHTATFTLTGDARGAGRVALGGLVVRRTADFVVTTQLDTSLVVSDSIVKFGLVPKLRNAHRWNRPVYLYDRLEQFLQRKATSSGIHTIGILGVFFDVLVENRNASTTVVVFHAEILDRSMSKLPIFADRVAPTSDTNVIMISDPSLHCDSAMPTAWFAGRQGCPVQDILLIILQDLDKALGNTRLIFAGATSGGFAALYFSHHFPLSLCMPWNPDINIANSEKTFVSAYGKACFDVDDGANFAALLQTRITSDLSRLYASGVPNHIVYSLSGDSASAAEQADYFNIALPAESAGRVVFARPTTGDDSAPLSENLWKDMLAEAVRWPGNWPDFIARTDLKVTPQTTRQ